MGKKEKIRGERIIIPLTLCCEILNLFYRNKIIRIKKEKNDTWHTDILAVSSACLCSDSICVLVHVLAASLLIQLSACGLGKQ